MAKRLGAIVFLSCTPAVNPSASAETFDATASTVEGSSVRWLSDILVHADGAITFSDVEAQPQRIAAKSKPIFDAGGDGSVAVAGADRVVAALRPGWRGCYNKGLQTDPDMAGRVIFAVRIPPDGKQPAVEVSGGSGLSAEVVACMKRKFEAVEFDPPGGTGSTLQVPVTFVQQGKPTPKQDEPRPPPAYLDFEALRACNTTARSKGFVPTSATFTIDDRDGALDVRVDPFDGEPDLLTCTANVVAGIEKGGAPRPFAFRIRFVVP